MTQPLDDLLKAATPRLNPPRAAFEACWKDTLDFTMAKAAEHLSIYADPTTYQRWVGWLTCWVERGLPVYPETACSTSAAPSPPPRDWSSERERDEAVKFVKDLARQGTLAERTAKWKAENEGEYPGGDDIEDVYDGVIEDARHVLARIAAGGGK